MASSKSKASAATELKKIRITSHLDILCGRGNGVNNTDGNVRYRKLIEQHRAAYVVAARRAKAMIAKRVVSMIHDSGGRFLRRDELKGCWFEIAHEKAVEKTCQALREDVYDSKKAKSASPPKNPSGRKVTTGPKGESKKTAVTKRHKQAVSKPTALKYTKRPKIDLDPETQGTRNEMLDLLWRKEQAKRQRAKDPVSATANLQIAENDESKSTESNYRDSVLMEETPTAYVPKHRLMSPASTVKDAVAGEEDATNNGTSGDENYRENFPTPVSAYVNGITLKEVESPPIQGPVGLTNPLGFHIIWFKEEEWEALFSQLVAFKKNNGHCAVPPGWTENSRLANWASYQRQINREVKSYRAATCLELTRLDRLNALGFVWDYEEWHWQRRYQGLHAPTRSAMLHWIRDQKRQYRDGLQGRCHLMRPDRVLLLSKNQATSEDR